MMLTVLGNMLAKNGDDAAATDTLREAQARASANNDHGLAAKAAMSLAKLSQRRGEHNDAAAFASSAREVFVHQADWTGAAEAAQLEIVNGFASQAAGSFESFYQEFARQLPAPVRLTLEAPEVKLPLQARQAQGNTPTRRSIIIADEVLAAMNAQGIDIGAFSDHLSNSRQRCYLCQLAVAETGTANLVLLQPQDRRQGDPLWVRLVHTACGPSGTLVTRESLPELKHNLHIECMIPSPGVAAIVVDCVGTMMVSGSNGSQGEALLTLLRDAGFQDLRHDDGRQALQLLPATKVRANLNLNKLTIDVNGIAIVNRAELKFLPAWYSAARNGALVAIFGRNLQGYSWDDPRSLQRAVSTGHAVAAAIPLTVTPPSRNAHCVCQMASNQKFKRCCGETDRDRKPALR